jgi:hypothetical protein
MARFWIPAFGLVEKARDWKVAAIIFLTTILQPLNSGGFPAAVFCPQLLTNRYSRVIQQALSRE